MRFLSRARPSGGVRIAMSIALPWLLLPAAAFAQQPTQASALVESCQSHLQQDQAEAAAKAAQQAIALDPANTEASLCLGVALEMQGRHAEAVAPLERVLAKRPTDLDALFALSNAYAALEDPRADALFDRLVQLRPDDVDVRLARVEYWWDRGENAKGNAEIERMIAAAPARPDLRVTYAIDLLRQWQFARAAEQLKAAHAQGLRTYQVAFLLGNASWEAGDIDGAVRSFSDAIEMDPSAPAAQHELGRLLLWMGQPAEAIPHLEKAAAAQNSAVTLLNLGRGYEGAGRLEDAERAYRQALALEPSLSPIYYAMGRLLKRMGKTAEAAAALDKYRQLYQAEQQQHFYETSHQAELDYALTELRRGNTADALARFERLGNTPDALIGRARALSRLNRHAEAIEVLERVRLLAPKDQRVPYLLARERAAVKPHPGGDA